MSSTRKIEGWIDGEPTLPPDPHTGFIASIMGSEANDGSSVPATLVIGGKAYTQAEVRAILSDLYSASMDGPYLPNTQRMDECLSKNGFTLELP